jgi:hypothetical protein
MYRHGLPLYASHIEFQVGGLTILAIFTDNAVMQAIELKACTPLVKVTLGVIAGLTTAAKVSQTEA